MPPWLRWVLVYSAATYIWDAKIRRNTAARQAREFADSVGKPMINVGAGLNALFGPTFFGDVNCDILAKRDSPCSSTKVCFCDAHDLSQWSDKHFGSLLASHLLEHVDDPQKALAEWNRVADRVFVIVPVWWAPHTWLHPGHQWFISQDLQRFTPLYKRSRLTEIPA